MRVLSGVQPSGTLHVGNYFGAIRQFVRLQEDNECFFFLADLHALTTVQDPVRLRELITDLAAGYLALGLDPGKSVVYRQSDLPEVTELSWYLSTVTSMGLLQRCHSFKDKVAQGVVPNHGLFAYPVLMAADILIVKSDVVPVGKDQKQHLEVTRDVAASFHAAYGDEVFVLPRPLILEDVAVVPGIDGRKMSKSYDNTIEIFGPEKPIRKKIMGIVTDSTPVEAPKPTEGNALYHLLKIFAPDEGRGGEGFCGGGGGLRRHEEKALRVLPADLRRGARPLRRAAQRPGRAREHPPRGGSEGAGDKCAVARRGPQGGRDRLTARKFRISNF